MWEYQITMTANIKEAKKMMGDVADLSAEAIERQGCGACRVIWYNGDYIVKIGNNFVKELRPTKKS